MSLSPLCIVQEETNPYVPTAGGVDVQPAAAISIKLADAAGVQAWFLQVIGTDELSSAPIMQGVDPATGQVSGTTVTFTYPSGTGRALGFRSQVDGVGGPVQTTFAIYSLTSFQTRVAFVTETREGNPDFGWATKINPLIRSGGRTGTEDSYTLTDVTSEKIIPDEQTMLFEDDVTIEDGGELFVLGGVTSTRTEDNFSMLNVPPRSERVVQQDDEMLFTNDLVVDGQLTVDGQLHEATPYDGFDVLLALTTVAYTSPAMLGLGIFTEGQTNAEAAWLSPEQAREVMDVPSRAEIGDLIGVITTPWSTSISTSGSNYLETGKVNRYRPEAAGMVLFFPNAPNDGDELEIKECTHDRSGTAPYPVQLLAAGLYVESVDETIEPNSIDYLTEYKTWIKYKFDASTGGVWRIVGAAYQLP